MRARALMIAVGLSFATAAVAEPAKAPVRESEQSADKEKPVVLASADEASLRANESQKDAAVPATPPRRARVTTCRCGDQDPSD